MIQRPLREQASLFQLSKSAFCQQLRSTLAGDPSIWEDEPAFAASLGEACEAVLRKALDPAFQQRQHARFGQGQPLEAFAAQLLSADSEAHAVAELRFKSLDPSQPFVELSLLTPGALQHLAPLVLAALTAFAPFRPGRARISVNELGAVSVAGLRVEPDLHCVAAGLRTLRTGHPSAPSPIELCPIADVESSYRRYTELYAAYGRSCPPIADELYCSSLEEFAEMMSHGQSFDAFCESRWAGLVAATPASLWGQPGWVMNEEFLSAEFRGRGLGLELQRALLQRLPGERGVLWGTIHAKNQPSLATALRHGRKIVQTHFWLLPATPDAHRGGIA